MAGELAVKEWDLPKWTIAPRRRRAHPRHGRCAGARQATGPRQARLDREIEKLATECGPGARLSEAPSPSGRARAERTLWTLADALVARDRRSAMRIFLQLRAQGERVESLGYWITRRLREALSGREALEPDAAPSPARQPADAAEAAAAFINDVGRTDAAPCEARSRCSHDLELDTRGRSALDADTLAVRTIARITA